VLPDTGFAPNRVTVLPSQPASKAYTGSGKMWLEIPALGLNLPITGVPLTQGGWDLTWLSNQAGYLSGTTFPGQVGNTGLTAHASLADGTPGPFHKLDQLLWGSTVILHHADGYRYTYEVRDNYTVLPQDFSVLKQDGYSWLTLITCKGYNPWLDTYSYRTIVRAVLLKVELEP
jgi:LPXTG-site transpeptidase (sortase) family protein